MLLLGKSVLDGDILSLNPSKLAQLLPERLQEDRDTRSSAIIQETYAEDFSWLLRVDPRPAQRECESEGDNPTPFWILDCRFSIVGTGIGNLLQRKYFHASSPPIQNPKSVHVFFFARGPNGSG
jgi:hypothetical protein